MKKIKNTVAAMSLMAVLGLGATAANAGMLMSDFAGGSQPTCADNTGVSSATGILIIGLAAPSSLTGILLGDFAPTTCTEAAKDGIIIVG